jgi:hypothetical protein
MKVSQRGHISSDNNIFTHRKFTLGPRVEVFALDTSDFVGCREYT